MQKRGLFLAITFLVVIIWAFSGVIHERSQVKVSADLEEVLPPINPNFDNSTLSLISQISPNPTIPPSPSQSVLPAVTPTPIASVSAQNASASATPSP